MENNSIKYRIETYLKDEIISDKSVTGGCIADSRVLRLKSGRLYFLKQGFSGDIFHREANSLKELAKPEVIKIPEVVLVDDDFLLLECIISSRRSTDFFKQFGRQLAQLHQYKSDHYGFFEDNYIGASPQYNTVNGVESLNWEKFYWSKRLVPQYLMAKANGYVDTGFEVLFERLGENIGTILEGSEELPSLLHGDLWSGNFMVGVMGEPVIIDPAVYYGHREADLAMTKMFGGFPPDFYEAYEAIYPLKKGVEKRQPLYLLYHVLNHLNLFGMGYYNQALSILKKYQ